MFPTTESITVEFKMSFSEEVIQTLVAFANANGGSVYIGITDDGVVKGTTIGKETIQNWINEIKNKTAPQLISDAEVLTVDNKTVVKIYISEYPVKPVSTRGKYYKRVFNANHLMNIEEITNEHLKTLNTSWDFYIDHHHSLNDIADEKVAKFIRKINQQSQYEIGLSNVDFLKKMEIIRGQEITFGAYLLFAKDYCVISDVQVGRFKSNTTIIDSLSLNTDLFQEVEDIIAFIKKHLMVEYIITGKPQREERFDYPLDAIREIVVNMIVHRDYRESTASIVKIYDDRIEFYNPGKLYGGITVKDLLTGNYISKSRNKLIAKAFKEAGLIERYGSGIMRVRKICYDYGIKDPAFYEISNGFMVTLFKELIDTDTKNDTDFDAGNDTDTKNDTDVDADNDTDTKNDTDFDADNDTDTKNDTDIDANNDTDTKNDTDVDAGNDTDTKNDTDEMMIYMIKQNNKITINELTKKLFVSRSKTQRIIKQLKIQQKLRRVGGEKNGYWEVINP